MKIKLIIILLLLTGISGCRKNNVTTYSDSGILTGFDARLCACCGGVFLESDDTKTYHIESLPGMTNEDFGKLVFPKRIKYNKSFNRDCSGIIYINITSYKFD